MSYRILFLFAGLMLTFPPPAVCAVQLECQSEAVPEKNFPSSSFIVDTSRNAWVTSDASYTSDYTTTAADTEFPPGVRTVVYISRSTGHFSIRSYSE